MRDQAAETQSDTANNDWLRRAIDLVIYVLAVFSIIASGLLGVSFLLQTSLVGVKYGLFVLGFLMLSYATLKIRPVRPGQDPQEVRIPIDSGKETPFQARLQRLLPRQYRLSHDDRLADGTKLFVASLFLLAISFIMETVLGINSV